MTSLKALSFAGWLAAVASTAFAQAPAGTLPAVTAPVADFSVSPLGTKTLDLSTVFGLPSVVGPVVQFSTVLGNLNVELYSQVAPLTCANFLGYVNSGAYNNTIINRSIPGFVEQGGSFVLASNSLAFVASNPPTVNNEFSVSNTAGTLAMAKISGEPDSATDTWFFNLVDNSSSLDTTDGGFTVFARVLGTGMTVVNAIAALPTDDESALLTFEGDTDFTNMPLINFDSSAGLMASNLVLIPTIATIPIYPTASAPGVLAFAATSSNPAAVAAAVSGSALALTAGPSGTAGITVTATDTNGNQASTTFNVTAAVPSPPVFTTLPQSQAAGAGQTVTFTSAASNSPTYQWQFNGAAISGATQATLTLTNVTTASAGTYAVVATNGGGTATASATLSILVASAPAFTIQPASQIVVSGTSVAFNAAASGSPTPTFQWKLNGTALSNATNARLVITAATAANAGSYTCVATNSQGSVTSFAATLSFTNTTNVGRLVNLSVNTIAGKSQVLTVGFVTGGGGTTGSQTLLLRATGPALAAFGVPNVLADPTLTVFSGLNPIVSNDNWGTNQAAVTAADSATGAFALSNPSSLDAALVTSLNVGGYTAQISGNTPASGTALAEVYDDTPANTYTLATPRLINVSSNNLIAANGSMTAGFVVGGTTSKTVLIRATGPALALLGVSGTMPDPKLALHTTINGLDTVLATNAGWGGDPQITAVDSAVGAFMLTNPASKDSVVLVTLAPGAYTAVASSVTGTAGVALIEVYEVP